MTDTNCCSNMLRSDLQVCAHGTGGGNMAVILKQFRRLGVRSWHELETMKLFLGSTILSASQLCVCAVVVVVVEEEEE